MVKWSPSVMGFKHRDGPEKMRQLYPPFLRTEYQDPSKVGELTMDSPKIEFVHRLKKRMSITDITVGKLVEIEDKDEPPPREGKDYRWWEEEEFGEDEMDRDDEKPRQELLWPLDRCKTYSAVSKHDDEPDTTDPYLSHELYLPYNDTPRPRTFVLTDPEIGHEAAVLPRRPRSPVRTLLPGKFDLRAAMKERDQLHRISETKEQLMEAKERIANSLQQLPFDPSNIDQVVAALVLETVCEEVTLLMMDVRITTDVRTFANAALFWALRDINIVGIDVLLEEEYLLMNRYRFANVELIHGMEVGHMLDSCGTRKMLLSAIHAPFNRSSWATLHRRLHWPYVCPAHEKGHPKYYPNVRGRIEETLSNVDDRVAAASAYGSDLTCYHFEDVSTNEDMAYRRKSKSAEAESGPPQIIRTLLVDTVDYF